MSDLTVCERCHNEFLLFGDETVCPDCTPEPEEPDVFELMESKKYAKRRDRDSRRALDELEEFN